MSITLGIAEMIFCGYKHFHKITKKICSSVWGTAGQLFLIPKIPWENIIKTHSSQSINCMNYDYGRMALVNEKYMTVNELLFVAIFCFHYDLYC